MAYVDGFVIPIPKKNIKAYRKMARDAGKLWRKLGALDYKECVADDLKPDTGGMKIMVFPRLVRLRKGETVLFSYVLYKSRAHRDRVNAKVMKKMKSDPKYKDLKMPFDMKRMAYGGFRVIVDV
jgi:uncharacterized protein YbaA (DUF1428 family)